MRIPLAVLCLAISTSFALAQQTPALPPAPAPNTAATNQSEPTGNPAVHEKAGKQQPQGKTGPLETEGEAASPENRQGGTPEGMQVHPTKPK